MGRYDTDKETGKMERGVEAKEKRIFCWILGSHSVE
jgi:hypothetical protein